MLDEVARILEEELNRRKECAKQGHSKFIQEIIIPCHPGRPSVTMQCTGCNMIYSRAPTTEEILDDYLARQIPMTI
jgi:hypothetical protein